MPVLRPNPAAQRAVSLRPEAKPATAESASLHAPPMPADGQRDALRGAGTRFVNYLQGERYNFDAAEVSECQDAERRMKDLHRRAQGLALSDGSSQALKT